ncbi:hypothetical protein NGA_0134302 [Nannochloropsis gaditana CCMP526]|uniref:uncharacterized protein n=1 Tax=Nannochloropsis gaditana (strain CCMP526) TaxID=1093141 RepID=UPI00029F5582|nr:hypothetical protein NGA_0134302 [Nannochloropsis gaditana CCMP526]XP_005855396.1 hypothetical protein NGA_0134301 [Nannochloropsis gaditana CCMP526]EKU20959.1 hypothetical protein NGA_0134301 [Nannochloropsis gaditana CCMP526]EKU22757.1 hypothetical protein NGA_0134302 [Nannochloropsis gaditana CCMP526]|eukprot:XP_005853602.1 hypothetical protein NGA_0134302 [Nannochloropsis gaditana CCMP526]
MAFLADVQKEVCDGEVPALPLRWWGLFAGILNFFFFGWGTILAGVRSDRPTTIFIGVLQIFFPLGQDSIPPSNEINLDSLSRKGRIER